MRSGGRERQSALMDVQVRRLRLGAAMLLEMRGACSLVDGRRSSEKMRVAGEEQPMSKDWTTCRRVEEEQARSVRCLRFGCGCCLQ